MEHLTQGNSLFVQGRYEEAIQHYTQAVSKLTDQRQFEAHFGRAVARIELKDPNSPSIMSDLIACLSLNPNHEASIYHYSRIQLRDHSNEYEAVKTAHKYLLKVIKSHPNIEDIKFESKKQLIGKCDKLLQKCVSIMTAMNPKTEIKSNDSSPSPNKKHKTVAATTNDTAITNNETSSNSNVAQSNQTNDNKTPQNDKKQDPPIKQIRDTWYQNQTFVFFVLYQKNLKDEDINITFEPKMVRIDIKLPDNSHYIRNINLKHEISAIESNYKLNKFKLELNLRKKTLIEWKQLEETIDDGKVKSFITAPWTTNRDWDKVDKFAQEEIEKEKPEGEQALQELFQKIYTDGDDDQKRAMLKSFQTSGGTVLSTNWDDVKAKDYEGKDKVLPTGQDVKKWEF